MEVAVDLFIRESEMALHVSASLAHAVHFCLFELPAAADGGVSQDGGDGQDSLSAHTCEYYIFLHYYFPF